MKKPIEIKKEIENETRAIMQKTCIEKNGEWILKNDLVPTTKTEAILEAHTELTETKENDIINYGYDFLDEKLLGIFPGDLVLVGSASGGGKTTFVNHIATNTAKQNKKVAFFLLEDDPAKVSMNDIYFEINRLREKVGKKAYPYNEYRKNKIKGIDYWYDKAFEKLKNDNIHYIKRADKQQLTQQEIISKIEEIKDSYDLIIIDHLHYIKFDKGRNRQEEIEAFMTTLSTTTISTKARIVLVAHYRKLGKEKPTDESFKDAQAIPQNATTTIHIHRNRDVEDEDGGDETYEYDEMKKYQTEFFIQKSRMPFGTGSITAQFNPTTNDYYSHTEWNPGSTPLTEDQEKIKQSNLSW